MNIGIFGIIVIVFVVIIILKIYHESDMFQLKCIVSDVDGNKQYEGIGVTYEKNISRP